MTDSYGRTGGGPPPAGNGSEPVYGCGDCGSMWTGGPGHHCRQPAVNFPKGEYVKGGQTAGAVVTRELGNGLGADDVDARATDVVARLYTQATTPGERAFAAGYDDTAAAMARAARELEADEPEAAA